MQVFALFFIGLHILFRCAYLTVYVFGMNTVLCDSKRNSYVLIFFFLSYSRNGSLTLNTILLFSLRFFFVSTLSTGKHIQNAINVLHSKK